MNNTGVKVLQAGHTGVECDDSVAEKMLLLLTRSTAPVCTASVYMEFAFDDCQYI